MHTRKSESVESCGIRRMTYAGVVAALLWIGMLMFGALSAGAVEPRDIPARLKAMTDSRVCAKVGVTLPMAADDRDQIDYDIVAVSECSPADTLLPVRYIVEWRLPSPSGGSTGFTSYFDGNLYRFRDSRLKEYHFDDNPDTFLTSDGGVQRSTQFMDVLPCFLADEIAGVISDSTYVVAWEENTRVDGLPASVLRADREIDGEIVGEFTYVIDPETAMPRKVIREMSPGSISEQTVTVVYTVPTDTVMSRRAPSSEDEVMALYPDVFDRFREKNYRLTSLAGQPVPAIALMSASGTRYTHPRGEKFDTPTVIVFVDESVSSTLATVKAVRDGVASMPFACGIIWIMLSPRADDIEAVLPDGVRHGETLLTGGRNILREFGVTEMPSVVVANPAGLVSDVIVGFNKNLESDVVEKMALAR